MARLAALFSLLFGQLRSVPADSLSHWRLLLWWVKPDGDSLLLFSSVGHTFLLWPCCHLYKPQCYLNYWISIKFTLTLGHFLWPLNSTPTAIYQTCSILVYHIHCLSAQGCLNGSLCLSLKMEKNNFVILTLSAWVSIPRVWVPL